MQRPLADRAASFLFSLETQHTIGYGTRQGFFAEWAFIADGAECDHDFGIIRNTGLIGHNNEWLNL